MSEKDYLYFPVVGGIWLSLIYAFQMMEVDEEGSRLLAKSIIDTDAHNQYHTDSLGKFGGIAEALSEKLHELRIGKPPKSLSETVRLLDKGLETTAHAFLRRAEYHQERLTNRTDISRARRLLTQSEQLYHEGLNQLEEVEKEIGRPRFRNRVLYQELEKYLVHVEDDLGGL